MTQPRREAASALVPGFPDDLCLGFANTRYYRGADAPTETLADLGAFLAWCRSAALLSADGERALKSALRQAVAGAEAFRDALALRETIYRIFFSTAESQAPARADLDALNHALHSAPERIGVARLWSAANLLTGPRLARVRHCANERCLWLFLDDSKSGTRRWCSMSACGNRAKAHRHYLRQKAG